MNITLEIGPDLQPSVSNTFFEHGDNQEDHLYLAIDDGSNTRITNPNSSERALNYLSATLSIMSSLSASAVVADAQQMPIVSQSIDEVILSNVLGQCEFHKKPQLKDGIVTEVQRVLKRGGLLTVYENITPLESKQACLDISGAGFSILAIEKSKRILTRPRKTALKELDKRYDKRPIDAWLGSMSMGFFNSGFFGQRYFIQAKRN